MDQRRAILSLIKEAERPPRQVIKICHSQTSEFQRPIKLKVIINGPKFYFAKKNHFLNAAVNVRHFNTQKHTENIILDKSPLH